MYATPHSYGDPDRNRSANAYNAEPQAACAPTATPLPTPDGTPVTARVGDILNLDHSPTNQNVQTVAIGDDSLAIGWAQAGELWYATAHGGSSLKPTAFTTGEQIALAYSAVNRLHIAWEEAGVIYYAAADDGDSVTATTPSEVGVGIEPHVLVDDGGWTHVLYTDEYGHFQHRRDRGNGIWMGVAGPAPLGVWGGGSLQIISVADNPNTPTVDSAFFATTQDGYETVVWRLDAPSLLNPQWEAVGRWTIALTDQFSGSVHLDAVRTQTGEIALVNTWVTTPQALPAPFLELHQPRYFAVNPYAPNGVANGEYIHEGLNAVGWETTEYAHAAGLMQTFATVVGNVVHASGWAKAWSSTDYNSQTNPANMQMQIGLDPTAGRNPNAATVIWSASYSPISSWQQLSVQLAASGSQMTLFLRARPNAARARSTAYFDDMQLNNASIANGSLEEPFAPMASDPDSEIPAQWEPFWEENANNAPARQPYRGYAVISTDNGDRWTTPQVVTSNQTPAQGATGALLDGVHPHILAQGVSLLYIYAHGDPAKEDERRFGRLHTTQCNLTLTTCNAPPGSPLLPRTVLRPVSQLLTARDPFDDSHTLAIWQMIQTDHERYDVLGTWIELE